MDKKKILLIEDDEFICQMYGMKFQQTPYQLILAKDGQEGLDLMKKEKPDLVFLDIVLPGLDGFEVLIKAKNDPELSAIPIMLLTNLGQEDHIKKGISLGAEDYIVKAHLTPQEVVGKVDAFFQKGTQENNNS